MAKVRKNYIYKIVLLVIAMFLTAIGIVMMRQANIGIDPWGVFSQGIERTFGITFGLATNLSSLFVMILAIILGESIGLGTLANVFLCGTFVDVVMSFDVIPVMDTPWKSVVLLIIGMEFAALGTWLYMSTNLSNGPRDSLMVALTKKTHFIVGICRIAVDGLVTFIGWLLGGQVGFGTIITAFGIGALINVHFKVFHYHADTAHQETLIESIKNFIGKSN